ncbi:hypothetical protein T265_04887 [Opisthorchis viverrini]|uniref:Uncharacterized protein n=1 Tax=Opisthorchis viverrini TaxID=6198 RepID=A0A074ZY37_OPIVI|nr:hypothetical protein T265_04887 [Opisthorchis viverrini]KER28210.1 hypothetical protein T265_04887 [Opisthorchis viverrini]
MRVVDTVNVAIAEAVRQGVAGPGSQWACTVLQGFKVVQLSTFTIMAIVYFCDARLNALRKLLMLTLAVAIVPNANSPLGPI